MQSTIGKIIVRIFYLFGLHIFFRKKIQNRYGSILFFHTCDKKVFERTIKYFKKNYNIVSFNNLIDIIQNNKYISNEKPYLTITFDDGLKSNYHLLETIIKYDIDPTIFLVPHYIESEDQFWWNILDNKSTFNKLINMDDSKRLNQLGQINNKSKKRDSLNKEEIHRMKKNVNFQSHSFSHPILTTCDDNKLEDELIESKLYLEKLLDTKVDIFAYPNGNYGLREILYLKKTGYKSAVTINHGFVKKNSNLFELNRINVGRGSNYIETIVCASGVYGQLKMFFKR